MKPTARLIAMVVVLELVLGLAIVLVVRSVPVGFPRTIVAVLALIGLRLSESSSETNTKVDAVSARISDMHNAVAKLQQEVARLVGRLPDHQDQISPERDEAARKAAVVASLQEKVDAVRSIIRGVVTIYLVAVILLPAFSSSE